VTEATNFYSLHSPASTKSECAPLGVSSSCVVSLLIETGVAVPARD
jgi:hypothetical protein